MMKSLSAAILPHQYEVDEELHEISMEEGYSAHLGLIYNFGKAQT
jgi:hypothetical protein